MPDLQTTIRKGPRRKYFYGFGQGDTIHAYTPEEWGLGGSVASNASNSTHSLVVLILIEAVITVPALLAPITGGWFFVLKAIREEIRARKFRQARGLPKPWYAVTDDQARNWFEQRAGTVAITRENFPNSARPFPGEERTDGLTVGVGSCHGAPPGNPGRCTAHDCPCPLPKQAGSQAQGDPTAAASRQLPDPKGPGLQQRSQPQREPERRNLTDEGARRRRSFRG